MNAPSPRGAVLFRQSGCLSRCDHLLNNLLTTFASVQPNLTLDQVKDWLKRIRGARQKVVNKRRAYLNWAGKDTSNEHTIRSTAQNNSVSGLPAKSSTSKSIPQLKTTSNAIQAMLRQKVYENKDSEAGVANTDVSVLFQSQGENNA